MKRFDVLDLARGLAVLVMLGSHLVGTAGGATRFERGFTGVVAALEPTAGALFCVLAGISWSIQAQRVGVTRQFRRYVAGRALALGLFGGLFHVLFWSTEILVPFAMMMALSLVVLGGGARRTAIVLLLFIGVTPVVTGLVAPYAAVDWLDNGLHVADGTIGWVTLRYLFVDGNYPLLSWMAFPLMGMLFWETAGHRAQLRRWLIGSLGSTMVGYAAAVPLAPGSGWDEVRQFIAKGWTPTSALFLLIAGAGHWFSFRRCSGGGAPHRCLESCNRSCCSAVRHCRTTCSISQRRIRFFVSSIRLKTGCPVLDL